MSSDVPYDPEIPDLTKGETLDDCEVSATPCAYTEYVEGDGSPQDLPATGEGAVGLEADVWDALYSVEDPEMPVSIVDLGLVYGVTVEDDSTVEVLMTLTYSGCPARTMLMEEMTRKVGAIDGVEDVELRLVWSPEWTLDMVTEQGKKDLREFGLSV